MHTKFPKGWDGDRVKRVLDHYEMLSEEEAVAEDEAAWEDPSQTFMEIPNDLIPTVRELLGKRAEKSKNWPTIKIAEHNHGIKTDGLDIAVFDILSK